MAQSSQAFFDLAQPSPCSIQARKAESTAPYIRQPFRRETSGAGMSMGFQDLDLKKIEMDSDREEWDSPKKPGLGIANVDDLPRRIKRVPVGSKDSLGMGCDRTSTPVSPESHHGLLSQATTAQNTPQKPEMDSVPGLAITKSRSQHSLFDEIDYKTTLELKPLGEESDPGLACPTEGDILNERWSWYTVPILGLAVYSTIFSLTFLVIALMRPRWGERIGTRGHISSSDADLLSALISKTIELSFVTVFVAMLGQILSRRAVAKSRQGADTGISIAEMRMRSWIVQPGKLLTHWTAIRYGATTLLGALAVLATVATTFYTTAAGNLVAPKLKYGPIENKHLAGKVSTMFANSKYLAERCLTPVTNDNDEDGGLTCLQIEHAGQSFHNFRSYLTSWSDIVANGSAGATSDSLAHRPPPLATFYDNTTVSGQWITSNHSSNHHRLVQNVTMTMPHANLFQAVRFHENHILQPDDLQGLGEYIVKASVPAPAVNILCVGLSREELNPLIHNVSLGPAQSEATAVDDFFRFSDKYEDRQPAPYFEHVPIPYNTVVNFTENWGPDSIYLLATPPQNIVTNEHILCSIKALQYTGCTTRYHAANSGGELSVHCDNDTDNTFPYIKSKPDAPTHVVEKSWKDVGSEWIKSIDLNNGVSDSNASIARLITEMIPVFDNETNTVEVSSSTPTIGEALGVLAACTLLLSSADAPFIHYWNYAADVSLLKSPQVQTFNATVKFKDYASGGTQSWQGILYLVLFAVFLLSLLSLCYLAWRFSRDGSVTDYTELGNLFALAINSPPSTSMYGTCGGGPNGSVLGKKWQVQMDLEKHTHGGEGMEDAGSMGMKHPHFYIRCPDDDVEDLSSPMNGSPISKKKRKVNRPPSMQSLIGGESPAVKQYYRLSGK
ncbi:MAG: hypothetical protein Q9160_009216 [Pyrenula sp. 1 TL-2023]